MSAQKEFTLEEIAKHNTEKDCWLVIREKVYDVTKFLEEHPGGSEVMVEYGGRDGTEGFDDVGHSTDAQAMLPGLLIGVVAADDLPKLREKTKPKAAASTPPKGASGSGWNPILVMSLLAVIAGVAYKFFLQ